LIYLYSGVPGAGKTLHATEMGLRAQARPGGTIANYAVTRPRRWWYVDEDQMTPELLRDHAERYHVVGRESQGLVIVDEAHRLLNSRAGWNEGPEEQRKRRELLRFFSEHRHFGYDVILVAQADLMLDKQVRFLIELEVQHFRLERLTWWLRWVPFPVFGEREFSYQFSKMKPHVRLTFFPPAMRRYDTQAMRRRWGGVEGRGGSPLPPPRRSALEVQRHASAAAELVGQVAGGGVLVPEGGTALAAADAARAAHGPRVNVMGVGELVNPGVHGVEENGHLVVRQ
jgi:zona occludens toxin